MKVSIRPILLFLVVAFGLSWIIALPLWLGKGLDDPLFLPVSVAMMFTPAVAALIVVCFVERPAKVFQALGLWPLKPARRILGYLFLGWVVPVLLVMAALLIGSLLGVYPADFVNFSGFKEMIDAQAQALGTALPAIPIGVLVALQFVSVLFGSFINMIPALGEELGWRGWLLPKLMPLGPVPAILISGTIWGLWHAPLVLLGYNYPSVPGWLGLIMMTGFCILMGCLFGWLRLRSNSVWPAALAHGALNASAGLSLIFVQAGKTIDTTQGTILGWSGWIIPLVLAIAILVSGTFKPAVRP